MGLFDRNKVKKPIAAPAVQINQVSTTPMRVGWKDLFDWKKGFRDFGNMYLYAALNQLYNGISNVTFEQTNGSVNYTVKAICSFIENNSNLLLNQYLFQGYIAVFADKDNNYHIYNKENLNFDRFGQITNKNALVYYSPTYQSKRKAPMEYIKPTIDILNNLSNAMLQSTDTMGVLPIISGESIPANPQFKAELAQAMQKEYGWGEDQMKYFLSKTDVKVQTIDLKVKELELRDNIIANFKMLLNYLEVPVDLVIGNSTYANVESAKIYFYDTTVRKYAEIFLKIAQAMLTASTEYLPKSTITYHIYNVSGLEKTLSDMSKEKGAYVDLLKKFADSGIDITDELQKVYTDVKRLYKEV